MAKKASIVKYRAEVLFTIVHGTGASVVIKISGKRVKIPISLEDYRRIQFEKDAGKVAYVEVSVVAE